MASKLIMQGFTNSMHDKVMLGIYFNIKGQMQIARPIGLAIFVPRQIN
jgi:hypothetical protein